MRFDSHAQDAYIKGKLIKFIKFQRHSFIENTIKESFSSLFTSPPSQF